MRQQKQKNYYICSNDVRFKYNYPKGSRLPAHIKNKQGAIRRATLEASGENLKSWWINKEIITTNIKTTRIFTKKA